MCLSIFCPKSLLYQAQTALRPQRAGSKTSALFHSRRATEGAVEGVVGAEVVEVAVEEEERKSQTR